MRTWKDLKIVLHNSFKISNFTTFSHSMRYYTFQKVKKEFNKFMKEWSICGHQTSHFGYKFQL